MARNQSLTRKQIILKFLEFVMLYRRLPLTFISKRRFLLKCHLRGKHGYLAMLVWKAATATLKAVWCNRQLMLLVEARPIYSSGGMVKKISLLAFLGLIIDNRWCHNGLQAVRSGCSFKEVYPWEPKVFGVKSLREIGRIFSTEIRNFKLWKMPKLLNFRLPEG